MTSLKKILAFFLALLLALDPVLVRAQTANGMPTLPPPGALVRLSPSFSPALFRGMVVDPNALLQFDFIFDPGDEDLTADDLKTVSQRMVHYFLASLTVPQQDLWVNLSPVEKDRILPDTLVKTELGRDLLAQDYLLKQLSASLIYPEDDLGRSFWDKVYKEAYERFGVTEVPVDAFNKVWVVPERASVIEQGNTVYIASVRLKVMLESDYLLASEQRTEDRGQETDLDLSSDQQDLAKQVLREIMVPAIEKEVNEGKNFAQLRQVVYALVLAQWYQEALKDSVLNRAYSGRAKLAGIDVSDPKNKELIYQQYLAAYKKGVFNYIKEEIDQLSNEPVPKKYFSGGIVFGKKVVRDVVDRAMLNDQGAPQQLVSVKITDAAQVVKALEPADEWYSLERPNSLKQELDNTISPSGEIFRPDLRQFIEKYSAQVTAQVGAPVEGAWPVLKAMRLFKNKKVELAFCDVLIELYKGDEQIPVLVDKILAMYGKYAKGELKDWKRNETPRLVGSRTYNFAAEIYPAVGGLGEVVQSKGKGERELSDDRVKGNTVNDHLGDSIAGQLWYTQDMSGNPLDYAGDQANFRFKSFNPNFLMMKKVRLWEGQPDTDVQVALAIDENDVPVLLYRDIRPDGSTYFAKRPYDYRGDENPVSEEESDAFMAIVQAELLNILETRRMKEMGNAWRPAVIHWNDGQQGALIGVILSRFGYKKWVREMLPAGTTHTIRNFGKSYGMHYVKNMLGIKDKYINAARARDGDYINHTGFGLHLTKWLGGLTAAVSRHHARLMGPKYKLDLVALTNGALPEKLARVFREEFNRLKADGVISSDADFERLTARENALTKQAVMTRRVNEMDLKTARGRPVRLDPNNPVTGEVRRLVEEKIGALGAYAPENCWHLVRTGWSVLLVGRYQGEGPSGQWKDLFTGVEDQILAAQKQDPRAYPGQFFFLDEATPEEKLAELAVLMLMVQDSWAGTGAAEYGEEHPAGAYIGTGPHREGVIADQGIQIKPTFVEETGTWEFLTPGEGNTVMPLENTPKSWRETVFDPLMRLWKKDRDHTAFFEGAALTSSLIGIMEARLTAADNMREYDKGFVRREREAWEDQQALERIVSALKGISADTLEGLLFTGRNGVKTKFQFEVIGSGPGAGRFDAESRGLRGFNRTRSEIEERSGYDALLHHFLDKVPENRNMGDIQNYLYELFDGLQARGPLMDWINGLKGTPPENHTRLGRFMEQLEVRLTLAQVDRQKALALLDGIGNGFTWKTSDRDPGVWSGRGLRSFMKSFDALEDQEGLLRFHDRGKFSDILAYLDEILGEDPVLAPLKEEVHRMFQEATAISEDRLERRVELAVQAMDRVAQYVRALEELEKGPQRFGPDGTLADKADAAQSPGGIDVRNIGVDRQGRLEGGVISDAALEELLMSAPGLQGVIINIAPIKDLAGVLGLSP